MTSPRLAQSLSRGALYMVASALFFAAMSAAVKAASQSLPTTMIVFFRNALTAAALAAVGQVGIRRLTLTEPTTRIVFYFAAISTVVSALPLAGSWQAPSARAWGLLLAAGLLATVGQLLLTLAYASAPAGQVGPFLYTSVVFSGLLDWALWGTTLDGLFLLGAALVVAAAILALRLRDGRRQPAPTAA